MNEGGNANILEFQVAANLLYLKVWNIFSRSYTLLPTQHHYYSIPLTHAFNVIPI